MFSSLYAKTFNSNFLSLGAGWSTCIMITDFLIFWSIFKINRGRNVNYQHWLTVSCWKHLLLAQAMKWEISSAYKLFQPHVRDNL